jgi:polyhydroxybutyrate depolymerase
MGCTIGGGASGRALDSARGTGVGDTTISLVSGGRRRTFSMHVPSSYARRTAVPLLLAFHGAGGTGSGMAMVTGLNELADRSTFVVVYPDAVVEASRGWALGCTRCTRGDAIGIDDYAFVHDLLEWLGKRLTIDRRRVFAAGFSLGGSFAYDLACREPSLLAGAAIVGSLPSPEELATCRPSTRPLRVLTAIGDRDPNLPWAGGVGAGGVTYRSAIETMRDWAARNRCIGASTTHSLADRDGDGLAVEVHEYESCPAPGLVRFFRLQGLGHVWPRNAELDVSEEIARTFFAPITR